MATNYGFAGPRIVRDGLVLYLDAGNPNSYNLSAPNIWKDISGNQNHTTLINNPTYSDNSIVLNGINSYIQGGALSVILKGVSTVTLQIWFNPSNLSNTYNTLVDTPSRHLSLWMGTNGAGQYCGAGGTSNVFSANFNWENNKWQLVTMIASTNLTTVKGDYTITETSGAISNPSYVNNISFGNNPSGGGRMMGGKYQIIRIYNRLLTQSEITQNYNATKGRFGL